ncbi:MAG TPA: flagellar basal body P-ring formation protein FlgA [Methylophaga aminisulfidivorans]|uniref:Flagella basal body P-ring formation protein FlgA n=1 Tax=Methylophaga aminisulfidivorans TaxID=230105 RepID=A0A7C1W2X0_9GAMM|nr:flagellar basal body P-ring formation protein FlgA [Methylophaga aminisulfidivorans]
MLSRRYILYLGAAFFTSQVFADTKQSLPEIEQAAFVYAMNQAQARYDNPQIIVESMDKRLRLDTCSRPLETFSTSKADTLGNRSIGIRCRAPTDWTVYVSVKVKVLRPVLVTTKPLAANHIVSASDIKLSMHDISDLRLGFVTDMKKVVGQQLKYPLAMGTALSPRSLKQRKVVQRGEHVVLVAQAGGMEIRMNGTAMQDAMLGERVRVENSSSKRIVEGVVKAPGIILVIM